MLKLWLKVIDTLPVNNNGLAFPEYDGSPLTHLERKVTKATGAIGYDLPNSKTYRKELDIRNKRIQGPAREAVSRSLSHSIGTATLYYQAPSQNDSISTYQTIQSLVDGREGKSPDIGLEDSEGPTCHASCLSKGKSRARNPTLERRRAPSPTLERRRAPSSSPSPSPPPRPSPPQRQSKKKRAPSPPQHRVRTGATSRLTPCGEICPPQHRVRTGPTSRLTTRGEICPPQHRVRTGATEEPSSLTPRGESLTPELPLTTSSAKRRKMFTEEETEQVRTFFKQHIADKDKPTLEECREFLTFSLARSSKNIQEKCRHLAGHYPFLETSHCLFYSNPHTCPSLPISYL